MVSNLKKYVKLSGIEIKLTGILVCLLTVTLLGYMLFNLAQLKNQLDMSLTESSNAAINRLCENLVLPFWNMDKAQAQDIIKSEMVQKEIYGVIIREADGKRIFLGDTRNDQWQVTELKGEITGDFLVKKADIMKEDKKIGAVEAYITEAFNKQELRKSVILNIVSATAINGLLILTLFLSLKLLVIRPIYRVTEGLGEAAGQVANASGEVSSVSQSLAEESTKQAASIEETSSSLEELTSMTKQNAQNAGVANVLMKETNQVVSDASEKMVRLTQSMQDISRATEETSKIIRTIDDIAFQTNLLALNAAVEAARAGEAGAGFAVVASEVRNLAGRAAEAAKSTANLIEGIAQKVKGGSELMVTTDQAFGKVAESTAKVGGLLGEISSASSEQAQGIDQISRAVNDMDRIVQHNVANSEESASAAEEMFGQAEQMKQLVLDLLVRVGGQANSNGNGARHHAKALSEGPEPFPTAAGHTKTKRALPWPVNPARTGRGHQA